MEFLATVFKCYILKPISLVFGAAILALIVISSIPENGELSLSFWLTTIICIITFIVYTASVIINNLTHKCPKNCIGVLFVIHAENDDLYDDFQYNLVNIVSEISTRHSKNISCICIQAEKTKKYNFENADYIMNLLHKRNCAFCVDVNLHVDSAKSASKFSMKINLGVVHPNYSENYKSILYQELTRVVTPVRNTVFTREQKIDICEITGLQISNAVTYISGVIFLLDGDYASAVNFFESLYIDQKMKECYFFDEIKKLYYISSLRFADSILEQCLSDHTLKNLDKVEKHLRISNMLYPDSYGYHINMAVVSFLQDRDIQKVKKHIAVCEKINITPDWRYSDSFITAYTSKSLYTVDRKYRRTVKLSNYNIVRIIDFIEWIIEMEPDKVMLHYALGLLYEVSEDKKLMVMHYKAFVDSFRFGTKTYKYRQKIRNEIDKAGCENCESAECENCYAILN